MWMFTLQAPNNVIQYSIIGDTNGIQYFYVNPTSGRLSLQRSIVGTGISPFNVSTRLIYPTIYTSILYKIWNEFSFQLVFMKQVMYFTYPAFGEGI